MISIKGLNKVFHSGTNTNHAVKNLTLDIEPGEIFCVIGKSGAGKTTLARCLNLLERPSSGSITIGSCQLTSLKEEELRIARQKIGYLSKHPDLLNSRTVYENIVLPLEFSNANKANSQHILNTVMNSLNLSDKANLYPSSLNLAQKQRVALARILVHQPTILICDDPTSHMDLKSGHSLIQLLRDLNEEIKLTLLYLTQDIENSKILCNRAAILSQGEIVEQGSIVQLFTSPTSTITRDLVKSNTRLELPASLRRRLRPQPAEGFNPVVRISFLGTAAHEPLIAHVIQQFGLTLHIIQAHLDSIDSQAMGILIVEMNGHRDSLEAATQFLQDKGLFIEVLGYVSRSS